MILEAYNVSIPVHHRETCRLCDGNNLELVLQLGSTPIGADYVPAERLTEVQETCPIDLFLCLDCGYAGLNDVVAPEAMFDDSAELTSMSLGVIENLQELAKATLDNLNLPKGSLIVDIGSNDGTLLKAYQDLGMRVLGVEPAVIAANSAITAGVPTMNTYFNAASAKSIKAEFGQASVISANRVLANIDNMSDLIEGVRVLLDPNGTLAFETGYLVDIVDKDLFDTIYHEHLGYDTAKAFDNYFRRHGMKMTDIERIPLKGGSLRGMVQMAGGSREISNSVRDLIDYEVNRGVNQPPYFKAFRDRLEKAKSELSQLMSDLKSKGKTVAGYGASVGSTTEIYYFDIGDKLTFLADDDPRNHDLFSPGHHIKVMPSQSLYDQKPDYVLILAWRYADPIIKKHQRFLDQGGHFIVPMPKLNII